MANDSDTYILLYIVICLFITVVELTARNIQWVYIHTFNTTMWTHGEYCFLFCLARKTVFCHNQNIFFVDGR